MENKAHALAAGLFVLAMAALLLALATWLTREGGERDLYEIATRESITGLQAQAPVRLRGVDVGEVASIGFDRQVPGQVLVRLSIDREAPMTRDTFATLGFLGVTGLAFVQLDDSGRPAPRLDAEGGAPPRIPLRPGLVSRLAAQGEDVVGKVDEATGKLNRLLADPNQERLARALDSLARAAEGVDRLAAQMVRTAAALAATTEAFQAGTLPRINQAADDAARAAREVSGMAAHLREHPQSLIFGPGMGPPGPGEPGFVAPAPRGGR